MVDDLVDIGLSTGEFSKALGVPESYLKAVLQCDEDITAELALRLSHYFGTTARISMNLQVSYDLKVGKPRWATISRSRCNPDRIWGWLLRKGKMANRTAGQGPPQEANGLGLIRGRLFLAESS